MKKNKREDLTKKFMFKMKGALQNLTKRDSSVPAGNNLDLPSDAPHKRDSSLGAGRGTGVTARPGAAGALAGGQGALLTGPARQQREQILFR